jgi:hypothetical protein
MNILLIYKLSFFENLLLQKEAKKRADNLSYSLATAFTSTPALKEKLKLARSLLAPLVPFASLHVKQQALTGNFFRKNQKLAQILQ